MIWRSVKPGLHVGGAYRIERASTVTHGWCGAEWRGFHRGTQAGLSAHLRDTKSDDDPHRQQKAKGLFGPSTATKS